MASAEEAVKTIECPICSKEFSSILIETHVSKCLFLNESTSTSSESFEKLNPKLETASDDTLFNTQIQNNDFKEPFLLSEKMRPVDIISYVGQEHIIGPQSMLYKFLSKNEIPNIILWGPPGCGKTSLANVIANICKHSSQKRYRYVPISAAMSSTNEIKILIKAASNDLKFGNHTIIFIDEIHRFNKNQQDIFLPYVEAGTIIIIGATTENPSLSINAALVSRCHIVPLKKLSINNLISILEKSVQTLHGLVNNTSQSVNLKKDFKSENIKFIIDSAALKWLAETSDGDARIALGGLELAIKSKSSSNDQQKNVNVINLEDIKENLKKSHMIYDKNGDEHYNFISALHKSVRASDKNAALYWLSRLILGGEDPLYIARRLVRMASEDIGMSDSKALINTMNTCKILGAPACEASLVNCTTYLATAPKSRAVDDSLRIAQKRVSSEKNEKQMPFYS